MKKQFLLLVLLISTMLCEAQRTPAVADLSSPPGTIVAFGGPEEKIPAGWVLCDGRLLDRTDGRFRRLFDAIGTSWGGNGANQFAVPDLRGQFLRGVTMSAPTDPQAGDRTPSRPDLNEQGNTRNSVGSKQGGSVQEHTHSYLAPGLLAEGGDGFEGAGFSSNSGRPSTVFTIGRAGDNGRETRPTNAYVHFIIKL